MQYIQRNSQSRRLVIMSAILTSSIALTSLIGPSFAGAATGGVDALIAHLHNKFKILPAQESLFQKLADTMRADAVAMSALAKKRADGATTMTAVDDLKSYAEISEAHAEGAKKMIPVFDALYDTMTDAQKKAADDEFREHYAAHHHQKH